MKVHSLPSIGQAELATFINGFMDSLSRCEHAQAQAAQHDLPLLNTLLDGYQETRAIWAEKQIATADDFNLFEVMEVAYDEVRHSMILAWLLDGRLEHGTHAQGNLGFRLFLQELGEELELGLKPERMAYADASYWVRREVSCSESRVDIEIAARKEFVIHIENKIRSPEGGNQTNREWKGLAGRAEELEVLAVNAHGIFLTLDGRKADNEEFHPLRWSRMIRVLDGFAQRAQPPEVRLFVTHYAKALSKFVVAEPKTKEMQRDEAVV